MYFTIEEVIYVYSLFGIAGRLEDVYLKGLISISLFEEVVYVYSMVDTCTYVHAESMCSTVTVYFQQLW